MLCQGDPSPVLSPVPFHFSFIFLKVFLFLSSPSHHSLSALSIYKDPSFFSHLSIIFTYTSCFFQPLFIFRCKPSHFEEEDIMDHGNNKEEELGSPVHSQVRKIKEEFSERADDRSPRKSPERKPVQRDRSSSSRRQISRSPLGISGRPISVGDWLLFVVIRLKHSY